MDGGHNGHETHDDAGRDIPHLAAPVLTARQALAAHFLHGCPHIIEIGGYKTPITPFLTHTPETVTSVDPKIEPLSIDEAQRRALPGAPSRLQVPGGRLRCRAL